MTMIMIIIIIIIDYYPTLFNKYASDCNINKEL
jgi:hypothetical protein